MGFEPTLQLWKSCVLPLTLYPHGTDGGIRTLTPFQAADFKSAVSAIPPHPHGPLGRIRTHDPSGRNRLLCPTELQGDSRSGET